MIQSGNRTWARMGWKWSQPLAGRGRIEYLWREQEGRCTVCGQLLRLEEEAWHIHHCQWRSNGGDDTLENLDLLHANCHRQIHAQPIAEETSCVLQGALAKA